MLIWISLLMMPLAVVTGLSPSPLIRKAVEVGEAVIIPCPLPGTGGVSFQWLQNGATVVLDPAGSGRRRQWSVSADGRASLSIVSARRSDAGKWECRELGQDGNVRKVAQVMELIVGSSPSDPYLELEGRKLLHQAIVTAREPQGLSVHCVVSGAIPPVRNVHWSIGESNLTFQSELFVEFSAEDDAYTSRSVLALNVTRLFHNKDIVCKVHHITWLQAAAVSASLNVLYDPSFSISRSPGFGFPLSEGMRVSLRCEVDANPPSRPEWVRDDGPITVRQDDGGFLNFSSIRIEHAGWYRCTTHHEFGFYASYGYFLNVRRVELSVESASETPTVEGNLVGNRCGTDGRPEVTAVNRSLLASAGRPALLAGQLCSDDARLLRVFWVVGRTALNPGDVGPRYRARQLATTETPDCWVAELELLKVEPEDSGEVLLVAKNTRGTADASFFLNVTLASSLQSSSGCQILSSAMFIVFLINLFWLEHWWYLLDGS